MITAGMTPAEFIAAMNASFTSFIPAVTTDAATQTIAVLNGKYALFETNTVDITGGMRGSNYISTLNSNSAQLINFPNIDEPSYSFPSQSLNLYADKLTFFDTDDKAFWFSFWTKLGNDATLNIISRDKEYKLSIATGSIYFTLYSEGGIVAYIGRRTATTVQAAITGAWHHVVCFYDGSKANSGLKIFVDKVQSDTTDAGSGSYVKMLTGGGITTSINMGTNAQMIDFRCGLGTLTTPNISNLYDHTLIGTESLQYPCSEGYGTILHNVVDNGDVTLHALQQGASSAWANTQDVWQYNYTNGGTMVNGYFFPNKNDKTKFFTTIKGNILAGQSNAYGHAPDSGLTGTAYESLQDADSVILKAYIRNYWTGVWNHYKKSADYPASYVSVDPFVVSKYVDDGGDTYFVKYGVDGSGLAQQAGDDWSDASVGELFDDLAGFIVTHLTELFKYGRDPYLVSFIWVQGENDAAVEAYANAYQTNLTAFFDKWKTLLPTFNIQLVRLSSTSGIEFKSTVRTKQTNFEAAYSNVDIIDTDSATFMDANTHYDAPEFIRQAGIIYNNIKNLSGTSYLDTILPNYVKIEFNAR